jgi:hypothetical protein
MSDYSKEHSKQTPGKVSYSAKPTPGSKKAGGKNHEDSIALGEGLPIGSIHSAHTKMQAHDAKLNPAPHKASHAQRVRVLSGNGSKTGEGSVTNQETGHGPLTSGLQNKKVQKKAHGFNERSQNGGANPSAFADCE